MVVGGVDYGLNYIANQVGLLQYSVVMDQFKYLFFQNKSLLRVFLIENAT